MKNNIKNSLNPYILGRIEKFWGYGNLSGNIWFVGMEEGYGKFDDILIKRIKTTSKKEIFDIVRDIKFDPNHMKWFKKEAPTQPTYRRLIYLILYLKNRREPTIEEIRNFQINNFGRKNSDHAILELMPLLAKSTRKEDWLYTDIKLEGLINRKEYLKIYKPKRINRLKELIKENKPKLVIFYSILYIDDWKKIIPVKTEEIIKDSLYLAKDKKIVYAIIPHSTAFGVSKKRWEQIAMNISNIL